MLAPDAPPRSAAFANAAAGPAARAAGADEHAGGAALGFCPASTRADSAARSAAWADAGRYVAVVNPARVPYAGRLRGPGNPTDPADAKLLAAYARRERPAAWQPPGPKSGNCKPFRVAATTAARSPPARRPAGPPRG